MTANAKTLTYYELSCDACGEIYEDDERILYPDASEVRTIAQDSIEWRRQPDGRDLCGDCAWTDEAVAERDPGSPVEGSEGSRP